MNKAEFLNLQRQARAEWDALIAQVPPDKMTQPDVVGRWSIKDLIAHVAWYENEMVNVITTRVFDGSPWWELEDVDERNARIYEQYRDVPLDKVLTDAKAIYQKFIEALMSLSDEELNSASYFRDMPTEWIPWQVIASNCFEHYPQHIPDVEAWLETQKTLHHSNGRR
jgi:uncharacterized damage-inducible protein DinB